jgi:hypothetical protein
MEVGGNPRSRRYSNPAVAADQNGGRGRGQARGPMIRVAPGSGTRAPCRLLCGCKRGGEEEGGGGGEKSRYQTEVIVARVPVQLEMAFPKLMERTH